MTRDFDRRQLLGLLGGTVLFAACKGTGDGAQQSASTTAPSGTAPSGSAPNTAASSSTADCTLTPSQTEGPYYLDIDKVRRDIREGRPGTPLVVALKVQAADCKPLAGAAVDIWHCDATGDYSGDGATFMRGTQVTDADGNAEFLTVYPGWYRGRTVHIHAKVHIDSRSELTTQLYFDDAVSDAVYATAPYNDRGRRSTRNTNDTISRGGPQLNLSKDGDGYRGALTIGVRA